MFYTYELRFATDFIYLWDIYLTLFVNKSHIRYFWNISTENVIALLLALYVEMIPIKAHFS